ncbi:MAG: flagellar hook assembly protein FlgD [Candidatus Polarisedimenticolaceae bacterium]|nr:flagellar hook assembly protein FlgD [Candidatus Polarisedimenticolaceae bacterium]
MSTVDATSDIYSSLGLTREVDENLSDSDLQMQDFMNLLVTELTHQDPFKPMENSEMATQISQFAAVSGIEELNTSFESLSTNIVSSQAIEAAGLVGRQVMIPSDKAYLTTGGTVGGSIFLSESMSNITLRVTNSSGELVREMRLGSHADGEFAFNWDGADDAGEYQPSGIYELSIQGDVGGEAVSPQVLTNADVESVSLGAPGQPILLNLNGLGAISLNDVIQIH